MRLTRRLYVSLAVSATWFLPLCAGADRSPDAPSQPDVVQFRSDYFLLPPPQNDGEASAPDRSLRLWSAPALSLELVLAEAERNEALSRAALAERARTEQARLCALGPADRRLRLSALESELARQHQLHAAVLARYEDQLAREAGYAPGPEGEAGEEEEAPGVAGPGQHARLRLARSAVQALARERSALVERYWRDFASRLADADADPAACAGAPGPELPREKLYAPYYLALYRFFEAIPPAERARLLVRLHPE